MARPKKKAPTAERIEARRKHEIGAVAGRVGVPEIQRNADAIAIEATAIIDGHTRPEKQTIRHLSRIEKLQRTGALTALQAAACQWYADAHALGFDTIGCTANYEGGGGGGCGVHDLLARHQAQADARDDYAWARDAMGVLPAHLAVFEQIVLGQHSIGTVAEATYELARTQREHKTRVVLQLCANRLAMLIGNRLPIEPAELPRDPEPAPANDNAQGATEPAAANDKAGTVWIFLEGAIARARAAGEPAAIRIATRTLAALQREKDCGDRFKDLPLREDPTWGWGYLVMSAAEVAAADELAADEAFLADFVASSGAGTDQGTPSA